MDKLKFVGGVVLAVIFSYIMLTSFMPVIVEFSEIGAESVNASAHITEYVGAKEGVQYMPLFLYFVPGVTGLAAIVWKLKYNRSD